MLNLWTFQRIELVESLVSSGILIPDFLNNKIIAGDSIDAYNYILSKYKRISNIECKGLIFGLVGNSKYHIVDSYDTLYNMLDSVGRPGGSYFSPSTHKLIHLQLPDNTIIMPIDFYRFSDLLYFMSDDGKYDSDNIDRDIQISKQYLFEPNLSDGSWELLVGHLPFIKRDWIKQIYTPKDLD